MTLHLKLPQKFPAGRSFNDDRGTSSLRGDEHITSIQNSRNAMPAGFFGSRKKSSEGKTTSWIPKPDFKEIFFWGGVGFPYCLPLFGGIQAKWQLFGFF